MNISGKMPQYNEEFAEIYAESSYTNHSNRIAKALPDILSNYDIAVEEILDLACGEGFFARQMADKGYDVKGIDLSDDMIEIAREKKSGQNPSFEVGDMREFSESGFDLVTCWFDSLNYIKTNEDLKQVFRNVRTSLKPGGYFIFDINTRYWLETGWPSNPCYVNQDNDDIFTVHRPSFDEEADIFTLKITGFKRDGNWTKFEEKHEERAYSVDEIKEHLQNSAFEVIDIFSDIESRKELSEDSKRAWFITKLKS